ncbi:hypothetical protein HL666_09100 [Bradyrhizobium sp. 83002]|uniref:hypothetical protein n=1 Tax=Bradyrhizobium aeschynomenes TaxID=2734909 RepID=UPI001558144C|nr:hypothetical protein [Bradyrhizobium aeschynomenes]NPU10917.1 hypothetical protein [Bradyrhizobium aeschynomenes]
MSNGSRPWTTEDEKMLRLLASTKLPSEIARKLNRSEAAVLHRSQKLGLKLKQLPQSGGQDSPSKQGASIGKICAAIATALGLALSYFGVTGRPPWPTEPIFSVNSPSFGSPFDVSFNATNKSAFFDHSNLKVGCSVLCSETKTPAGGRITTNGTFIVPATGPAALEAGQTQQFMCNLRGTFMLGDRDIVDRLPDSAIAFVTEYDQLWGWWHKKVRSDPFSLNKRAVPPQWVQGRLPGSCKF